MEESEERDYTGLFSFVLLSYIIAPFQAFASVRGFLENEEGPWFRTPKTGRITDSFTPGRFIRFVKGMLGSPAFSVIAPNREFSLNSYLALSPDKGAFLTKPKRPPWRIASVLAVFLLVTMLLNYFALFPLAPRTEAAWYNSNYTYKKQITINKSMVNGSSNLTDFPVLISEATDNDTRTTGNGGYVTNASGYDIIFTDSTEATKLDHEVESYNSTNGSVNMWVRIPTLSASSDTNLWMYFGNSSVNSSQENITGVWDSNYQGVWHMSDNADNKTIKDSTNKTNAGNFNVNTSTRTATGKIAGALTFNGYPDNINTTSTGVAQGQAQVTFSAWVNATSLPSSDNIQREIYFESTNSSNTNTTRFSLVVHGTSHKFRLMGRTNDTDNLTTFVEFPTIPVINTPYYVVGVYDSTAGANHLIVNGVDQANTINEAAFSASTSTIHPLIGADPAHWWDGTLDEIRVSNITRSVGWSTTEYNNQNSPSTFEKFGDALEVPENLLLFLPLMFFLPKIMESIKKRQKLCLVVQQCNMVNSKAMRRSRNRVRRVRSHSRSPG